MGQDLKNWDIENDEYWESTGKKTANRNLWISIPSLLCGFAVWLYWSIITVQMINLDFPFEQHQLFTLMAIAGISGATLRIPATFFIRIAGGRNTVVFTTSLLMIPALGTGIALMNPDTPLWQFQVLAVLSGIGGGNFSASMSNINFFFPKKMQGYSLGMNAGLGNFGVSTMQIVIPLAMTFAVGPASELTKTSGTLIGKIPAGTDTYIHNAGFVWLLALVPLMFIGWWGMNNIKDDHVTPDLPKPVSAFASITGMYLVGFATAIFGLWLMLPAGVGGSGLEVSKWIVLPIIILMTVVLLRLIPGAVGQNLSRQYQIFKNKHTWAMTIIYIMTFGSFIGYAAAFGLVIRVVFGFQHIEIDGVWTHNTSNPDGPSALMFAWMGPFIGALIRPIGGMLSDKVGGARVTHWMSVIMVIAALGVSYFLKMAYVSATPQDYFVPFLILFLILFAATGIANGSTFRTMAIVFNREQAGPVLGWTAAIGAYGAFLIPQIFGAQLRAGTPEYALYGFAVFYVVCIIINWWFYLRPNAYVKNP